MKAEIFKKRKQLLLRVPTWKEEFRFRLIGDNGEIIGQSEGYTRKQSALDTVRKYFPDAEVVDSA